MESWKEIGIIAIIAIIISVTFYFTFFTPSLTIGNFNITSVDIASGLSGKHF